MKSQWTRLLAAVVGVAVFSVVGFSAAAPAGAATPRAAQSTVVNKIRGHVTGTTAQGGTFTGSFTPTHFVTRHSRIVAVGTLRGTLSRPNGHPAAVRKTVRMRVTRGGFVGQQQGAGVNSAARPAAADPTCQILNLVLGPLHLNLLGLVVDLNQVHLVITAQSGPGNLLGNLLCAIAGLLNGSPLSSLLTEITDLLNSLLGGLGGLTL